jgi:hypothetical protein
VLAKLTSKNQLTLPKAIVEAVGEFEYYDVAVEQGRIVLTPVRIQSATAVRDKLERLGIADGDVRAAIEWARKRD